MHVFQRVPCVYSSDISRGWERKDVCGDVRSSWSERITRQLGGCTYQLLRRRNEHETNKSKNKEDGIKAGKSVERKSFETAEEGAYLGGHGTERRRKSIRLCLARHRETCEVGLLCRLEERRAICLVVYVVDLRIEESHEGVAGRARERSEGSRVRTEE